MAEPLIKVTDSDGLGGQHLDNRDGDSDASIGVLEAGTCYAAQ